MAIHAPCLQVLAIASTALLSCATLVLSDGAGAQQPSKELKELQETSTAFWKAGDFASALQLAEQALPLVIREYGPEHEQTGIQYYSLGLIAQAAGNLPRRRSYFTETVRVREKVYGARARPRGRGARAAGQRCYVKRGRPDAAEPLFRRALKIEQDLLGAQSCLLRERPRQPRRRERWRAAIGRRRGPPTARRSVCSRGRTPPDRDRQADRRGRDPALPRHLRRAVPRRLAAPTRNRHRTRRRCSRRRSSPASRPGNTSAASALAKMTARLGTERYRSRAAHPRRAGHLRHRCWRSTPRTRSCSPNGTPCRPANTGLQRGARGVPRRQHRAQPRSGARPSSGSASSSQQ